MILAPDYPCYEVVSQTLKLKKGEMRRWRPFLPTSLKGRVSRTEYTWYIYFGEGHPGDSDGRLGDVWIDLTWEDPSIYIKSAATPPWNPWRKKIKMSKTERLKHSVHPWLRQRFLQFDGTTLVWHHRHKLKDHRKAWDAKEEKKSRLVPPYTVLHIGWIAHYMGQNQSPPLLYDSPLLRPPVNASRSTSSPGMWSTAPTMRSGSPLRHRA